ncbi:hypothetical protein PR048_003215 [Dryococelus australis]|uniref:Uncharacterized protein n=1 Tax=Dryococelus australis TaxID=614101 RepID=A0ABQ9IMZ4_9NEOP|nr:hypothetical protein PR048_003215 [Dryococelus australis]
MGGPHKPCRSCQYLPYLISGARCTNGGREHLSERRTHFPFACSISPDSRVMGSPWRRGRGAINRLASEEHAWPDRCYCSGITLASHQGEPGSNPGLVSPGFLPIGFLRDLQFPPDFAFWRCFIRTPLHLHRLSRPRYSKPPRPLCIALHSIIKGLFKPRYLCRAAYNRLRLKNYRVGLSDGKEIEEKAGDAPFLLQRLHRPANEGVYTTVVHRRLARLFFLLPRERQNGCWRLALLIGGQQRLGGRRPRWLGGLGRRGCESHAVRMTASWVVATCLAAAVGTCVWIVKSRSPQHFKHCSGRDGIAVRSRALQNSEVSSAVLRFATRVARCPPPLDTCLQRAPRPFGAHLAQLPLDNCVYQCGYNAKVFHLVRTAVRRTGGDRLLSAVRRAESERDVGIERLQKCVVRLGVPPFAPPFHSGATLYSTQSPLSALKTSLLRTVTHSSRIRRGLPAEFLRGGRVIYSLGHRSGTPLDSRLGGPGIESCSGHRKFGFPFFPEIYPGGAAVAQRLACSPLTKANRVKSPVGSLRIFARGNRAGRCCWSAGFIGVLPFPPLINSFLRCSILSSLHPHWFSRPTGVVSDCCMLRKVPSCRLHQLSYKAPTCEMCFAMLLVSDAILLASAALSLRGDRSRAAIRGRAGPRESVKLPTRALFLWQGQGRNKNKGLVRGRAEGKSSAAGGKQKRRVGNVGSTRHCLSKVGQECSRHLAGHGWRIRGLGGSAVRLLASHQVITGSISGRVTPYFCMWGSCRTMPLFPPLHSRAAPFSPHSTHIGSQDLVREPSSVSIVPDDASGRRVFSGISRFPRPCIPVLLHIRIASPSSAPKTSMLGAKQLSALSSHRARVNTVRCQFGVIFYTRLSFRLLEAEEYPGRNSSRTSGMLEAIHLSHSPDEHSTTRRKPQPRTFSILKCRVVLAVSCWQGLCDPGITVNGLYPSSLLYVQHMSEPRGPRIACHGPISRLSGRNCTGASNGL